MAVDRRRKNEQWSPANTDGTITWERVDTALLMDIRDELQTLNRIFQCQNFLEIPRVLRAIRRNTAKPRKRKQKAKQP